MCKRVLLATVLCAALAAAAPTPLEEKPVPAAAPAKAPAKAAAASPGARFWAKANAFYTAFSKQTEAAKKRGNEMMAIRALGPGGFLKQYGDMHSWYCGKDSNKAKSICPTSKAANRKGAHPLFSTKHPDHKAWGAHARRLTQTLALRLCAEKHPERVSRTVEMANGYCAESANAEQKTVLCKILRLRTREGSAALSVISPAAAALAAATAHGLQQPIGVPAIA